MGKKSAKKEKNTSSSSVCHFLYFQHSLEFKKNSI